LRGPFHLGRFSLPIAGVAVAWIAFISIVFILPQLNPVNSQTLNYAIVAVGIVIIYSLGFWFISAHKWFTGPVKQIAGASVFVSLRWSVEELGFIYRRIYIAEGMGVNVTDPATMAEKPELLDTV